MINSEKTSKEIPWSNDGQESRDPACLLQLSCVTLGKFLSFRIIYKEKRFNADVLGGPSDQDGNKRQTVDDV